ncbi:hypothetical protein KKG41_01570 [Patescibacteria group bacterium]|nr:hypothetical protein [Patescibacteria group bacterium]
MTIDERLKEKFKNYSNKALVTRANKVINYNWDDESCELSNRHKLSKGKFDYYLNDNTIIIIKDTK